MAVVEAHLGGTSIAGAYALLELNFRERYGENAPTDSRQMLVEGLAARRAGGGSPAALLPCRPPLRARERAR